MIFVIDKLVFIIVINTNIYGNGTYLREFLKKNSKKQAPFKSIFEVKVFLRKTFTSIRGKSWGRCCQLLPRIQLGTKHYGIFDTKGSEAVNFCVVWDRALLDFVHKNFF
jgi:hypothetical protein